MTGPFDHEHDDGLERAMFRELSDAESSPDLTHRIMGRLGYMHASPRVVRRRRVLRWCNRLAIVAITVGVIAVGVCIHESGPDARRPAGPTIPSAVIEDVNRHQQRLIDFMQQIGPPPVQSEEDEEREMIDEETDRSAIGPFRVL